MTAQLTQMRTLWRCVSHENKFESLADIIFSVLDPAQKANHIRMYWGEDLHKQALIHAEAIVSHLF